MEKTKSHKKVQLIYGDCLEKMKDIPNNSIDMVLTSPPYDNLRNYNKTLKWGENVWQPIIKEIYSAVKDGGVVIWVVGDATIDKNETGSSLKQALYFKEIGFNLYDTMIYQKRNPTPMTHNRYTQEWEYMFCFSKGSPKTFNPIKVRSTYAGKTTYGKKTRYNQDGELIQRKKYIIHDKKIKGNIFAYNNGSLVQGNKARHPAIFPLELAKDQIISWTNKHDVVLDPFMGSGTTGVACKRLRRNFIGIELDEKYFKIAEKKINETVLGFDF